MVIWTFKLNPHPTLPRTTGGGNKARSRKLSCTLSTRLNAVNAGRLLQHAATDRISTTGSKVSHLTQKPKEFDVPRFRTALLDRTRFLRSWLLIAAASAIGAGVAACQAQADVVANLAPFEQKVPDSEIHFKMVPIPGGTFAMGSPEGEKGRKDDEGPQHQVQVEPFFMEEHVVTWAEYLPFLGMYNSPISKPLLEIPKDKLADAVTYPTPIYDQEASPKLERMGGRGNNYPAVIMSQFAARQYTKWLSKKTGRFYRLPTEAEWEYACRAGTKTAYFFGDDPSKLGDYAWYAENSKESDGDTGYHPIMQKKPNPWGLYDMYGNVTEWCVDQYKADWYKQFEGKITPASETINWPKTQYPRVLRGGSYISEADECRSAARDKSNKLLNAIDPQIPKSPHWLGDGFFIGFRVVSPVKEPSEAEKHKWWDADDPLTQKVIQRDREHYQVLESPAEGTGGTQK